MHDHAPHSGHHGHPHDQGLFGFLRYLRLIPEMWRSPVSAAVVAELAPQAGERVVDLGAGMGAGTAEALRSGARILAVDPTGFMRTILSLRRRAPGWGQVEVLEGAAEAIPVPDASIDALWTVNTIHHWTQRARACRELARVMRPGGRILLLDEDLDDPTHPWHERAKSKRHHHFDEVDAEVLAKELLAAGFTTAEGSSGSFGGHPSKIIRAVR